MYKKGRSDPEFTLRVAHEFLREQLDSLDVLRHRFRTCMRPPFVDQVQILDLPRVRRDVVVAAMSCLLIASEIERAHEKVLHRTQERLHERCFGPSSNSVIPEFEHERQKLQALLSDLRFRTRSGMISNQKNNNTTSWVGFYTDAEYEAFENMIRKAASVRWSLGERAPIVKVVRELQKL